MEPTRFYPQWLLLCYYQVDASGGIRGLPCLVSYVILWISVHHTKVKDFEPRAEHSTCLLVSSILSTTKYSLCLVAPSEKAGITSVTAVISAFTVSRANQSEAIKSMAVTGGTQERYIFHASDNNHASVLHPLRSQRSLSHTWWKA